MLVFDGLAEGGQSTDGSQRRDICPAKETRRVQGTPAVRRRSVRRSADRSSLSNTTRLVGCVPAHVQPVSHRLHTVWRAQTKRNYTKCCTSTVKYNTIIIILLMIIVSNNFYNNKQASKYLLIKFTIIFIYNYFVNN